MSEDDRHSLILACDFRVDHADTMWDWLQQQRSGLADIGAHHVVVYASIWEPGRVLVTMGIRQPAPIRDILRSPRLFEWFDVSGADDIPPVFGGEIVEKIDLDTASPTDAAGRVVIGVMSSVDDVSALMVNIHDELDRIRRSGVRQLWVYRGLGDEQEVMILQEVASEAHARRWVDRPDAVAKWLTSVGLGPYPSQFIGRVAHVMTLDEHR